MQTAAVDELFGWLKKLDDSNREYKKKKAELEEEKKLLKKSIEHLDELMEREVDISKAVADAVISTPLEDVIEHASKKGFKPSYYPNKIEVNDIKHVAENLNVMNCDISFIRPATFDPKLTERTIDYAIGCFNHEYHICNFSKEQKTEFLIWMLPIRYVLDGPIAHYTDKDDKKQTYDFTGDLDKEFVKLAETTLKDKPAERLKEARKAVMEGMKTTEFFHINFYLRKDGSLQTCSSKGLFDGVCMTYPYGHAKPCYISFPLLKDGEKWPKGEEPVWGKSNELCQALMSRIDEYDALLEKAHKKDGYRFVMDEIAEMNLKTLP